MLIEKVFLLLFISPQVQITISVAPFEPISAWAVGPVHPVVKARRGSDFNELLKSEASLDNRQTLDYLLS